MKFGILTIAVALLSMSGQAQELVFNCSVIKADSLTPADNNNSDNINRPYKYTPSKTKDLRVEGVNSLFALQLSIESFPGGMICPPQKGLPCLSSLVQLEVIEKREGVALKSVARKLAFLIPEGDDFKKTCEDIITGQGNGGQNRELENVARKSCELKKLNGVNAFAVEFKDTDGTDLSASCSQVNN